LETHCLRRSWRTRVLGASLFVLLDLIIDPVALQGHRWFLGQIYGYRVAGIYFGVPLSNFAGWFIVGLALITLLQGIDRLWSGIPRKAPLLSTLPGMPLLGPALYLGVLGFNLAVTFWIGERFLGLVGCLILTYCILLAFFLSLYKLDHLRPDAVRSHLKDFPHSPAALLLDRERNRDGFPPSCA
jgi:putative membrane protein